MYVIFRKDYYKLCFCIGIISCIICCIAVYIYIAIYNHSWNFIFFISLFMSTTYTLFYLVKFLRKKLDFVALRIDNNGIFLCSKKSEGVFIPWHKIKHVIFVVDEYGSKIVIHQYNKENHYLLLTDYFNCFRPQKAIKAAYKYADNAKKIREVKDDLVSTYESIMWRISETEVKHENNMR